MIVSPHGRWYLWTGLVLAAALRASQCGAPPGVHGVPAAQVARALGLDKALPVAAERLKEQRDISVRNVSAWAQDLQDDLGRYRANSGSSLQVTSCLCTRPSELCNRNFALLFKTSTKSACLAANLTGRLCRSPPKVERLTSYLGVGV